MSSANPPSPTDDILRESDLDPDPVQQFGRWFSEAMTAKVEQPEAMTLATATPEGEPSARMVLLRGFDQRGFAFFTNYDSDKARDIAANARAALVFYWAPMNRQVRVEGTLNRTSEAESDEYFESRPRESQVGAWASPQSRVLPSRDVLEQRVKEMEARFAGKERIPRPPNWGGFRLVPETLEFWQGQPGRLHDRIRYRKQQDGSWIMERLAP